MEQKDFATSIIVLFNKAREDEETGKLIEQLLSEMAKAVLNGVDKEFFVRWLSWMPVRMTEKDKEFKVPENGFFDLVYLLESEDPTWVYSAWSVQDVETQDKKGWLNKTALRSILDRVRNKHNASIGINWDVIHQYLVENLELEDVKEEVIPTVEFLEWYYGDNWFVDTVDILEDIIDAGFSTQTADTVEQMAEDKRNEINAQG